MSTAALIVSSVLGLVGMAANLGYWWWVMTRGQARWRARLERRYGVRIENAGRGMWHVVSDRHGWFARLGIEMLQLAFFMGAMVVWSVAIIGVMLVISAT